MGRCRSIVGAVLLIVSAAACGTSGSDNSSTADDDELPEESTADCDDAILIDDVYFAREYLNDGVLDADQLTDRIGVVGAAFCGQRLDERIQSTYLAAGTELRAIAGHDAASRFAAVTDDGIVVYGRGRPGRPADALDDVERIVVLSEQDGRTELGRIDDAETVRALVDELDATAVGDRTSASDPQQRVFIGLVHHDGLTTQLVYDLASNAFLHGDRPSEAWATAVTDALARSGDGVVDESSITRADGGQIPLRLAGSCFPTESHATVGREEVLEVVDPRPVQYVWSELYDSLGEYVDVAPLLTPGEGFTSPGNTFTFATAPTVSRAIIEVAFLDGSGQPSDDIALCATFDLAEG